MRRSLAISVVAFAVLLLVLPTLADDHEQSITLKQVPAKVMKAAVAAVPGLKVEEATIEAILIYEVAGDADGKKIEVEVTAEGRVIEVERGDDDGDDDDDDKDDDEAEHELAVPVETVPAKVREAALAAVPGLKLTEAGVEAVLIYELEGEAGGKEVEIEVTDEGDVLEIEHEDDDD